MIDLVKVLFATPKTRGVSSKFGDGKPHPVEAWFQLDLHDGPPDPTTWEGSGQTVAYWRDQFKGLKDPGHVTFDCHDVDGVPEAVFPMGTFDSLPEDARISFGWTVCRVKD